MQNRPRQNSVYTVREILTELFLRDMAHLGFTYQGQRSVIQESHITEQEFLDTGISEVKFTYMYETSEWIPVFRAVDNEEVLAYVDITEEVSPYRDSELEWWVTPKGCPRQMFEEKDSVYAARLEKDKRTWTQGQHELCARVGEREKSQSSLLGSGSGV